MSGPTVTKERIQEVIVEELYIQPTGTTLTICMLRLRNGFTVTGESACVSANNFNADLGKRLARENAESKIWTLEGYALADRLAAITGEQ